MKVGIMQPYFLPYIGYFQLISSVDKFVIYDDVQFIKGGWINRNNMLVNGNATNFVLNIKKDSYELNINERYFSNKWDYEINKLIKGIEMAYKKAPYFNAVMKLVEEIFKFDNRGNIAKFITNSLKVICSYLDIDTEFMLSSNTEKRSELKGQEKVIDIVSRLGGKIYVNSYGGSELYSKNTFKENGMELKFIKPKKIVYTQFKGEFVSNLSILDVLMFNSKQDVIGMLNEYEVL